MQENYTGDWCTDICQTILIFILPKQECFTVLPLTLIEGCGIEATFKQMRMIVPLHNTAN